MGMWERIDAATGGLEPPFVVVDLLSFDANAANLEARAAGTPIRVASKSVRCRALLERVEARAGFAGVLCYALPEALELARAGMRDLLVAYPTTDRAALAQLTGDPALADSITLMVDSPRHLQLIAQAGGTAPRLCIDVDASWQPLPCVHIGVRRSPVFTPPDAAAVARAAVRLGLRVAGVMLYEAQVAGLPDTSMAVRAVKAGSLRQLTHRRLAIVEAIAAETGTWPELVNGGGTGSVEATAADPVITEVAAGSGLYGPTLFDGYRTFRPHPALFVALPVVRRPKKGIVTAFSGGYIASGPPGTSRQPTVVRPGGLRYLRREGPGEVQTPVRGRGAQGVEIGDRLWMRVAKAGEICERFATVHLVEADGQRRSVPTYRGEGWAFG